MKKLLLLAALALAAHGALAAKFPQPTAADQAPDVFRVETEDRGSARSAHFELLDLDLFLVIAPGQCHGHRLGAVRGQGHDLRFRPVQAGGQRRHDPLAQQADPHETLNQPLRSAISKSGGMDATRRPNQPDR